MKRTLDDLRGALHDEADGTAYPDVEALVAGAGRRVVASRRRRVAALGAATAAVVAIGGLVATTGSTRTAEPQPAAPSPFSVNADGAGFPKYDHGLKLLTVLDAPMLEHLKGSFSVPTTPGRQLAVRMACTQAPANNSDDSDNMNEWNSRMVATFAVTGGRGQAQCGFTGSGGHDPIGIATEAKTTVLADVSIDHEPKPSSEPLFKGTQMHVAIYESVPWESYPLPPRPAGMDTDPSTDWSWERGSLRVLGPKTAQEANKPLTVTQPFDPTLELSLQTRGPGRMRMLIDGKAFRFDPIRQAEDAVINFWGYDGNSFSFPLDARVGTPVNGTASAVPALPKLKPGTPVTVSFVPQDFQGPDWRVTIRKAPKG